MSFQPLTFTDKETGRKFKEVEEPSGTCRDCAFKGERDPRPRLCLLVVPRCFTDGVKPSTIFKEVE